MESNRSEKRAKSRQFWNELYWFVTIGLVGGMFALWVIPPRALESLSLLKKDIELEREVVETRLQTEIIRAAKTAAQSDPYYRDRLRRASLDVKREGEEVIELSKRRDRRSTR